jgi:hypothetical protein
MNQPTSSPYSAESRRVRRRTMMIVIGAAVALAVGVTLHLAGILPPR